MKGKYFIIILLILMLPIMPITSQVSGESTHAVANAHITLATSGGKVIYAHTDSNGEAVVLVKPTTHTITVEAFGNIHKVFSNVNFAETDSLDVTMQPAPVVSGRVTVNGKPASGYFIDVGGHSVFTDSEGRFYVPVDVNVGGKVDVNVYSQGDVNLVKNYKGLMNVFKHFYGISTELEEVPEGFNFLLPYNMGTGAVEKSLKVNVNSMHVNVDIDLDESLVISGHITDGSNPVSGAVVMAVQNSPNNPLVAFGISDDEGHYVINYNIVSGSYNLTVLAVGYSEVVKGVQVNGNITVDFTLTESPTLSGRVVSEDNKPISNAYIMLQNKNTKVMLMATADENGEFYIDSGLSEGTWEATYGYMSLGVPIVSNKTLHITAGSNNVELELPVRMMKFEGDLDDPARDNLLEPVEVTVKAKVSLGGFFEQSFPFTFVVPNEGHFEFYVPVSFSMQGQEITVSSYDVSVSSQYYYDSETIASNVQPATSKDLGTVQVDSGSLVEVTIHVSSSAGDVSIQDMRYNLNLYIDDTTYNVTVITNSTILYPLFQITQSKGQFFFNLGGQSGSLGEMKLLVPKSLMSPPFTVKIDGKTVGNVDVVDKGDYVEVTIHYSHSTHDVSVESANVVPDFPVEIIGVLLLLLVIGLYLWKRH